MKNADIVIFGGKNAMENQTGKVLNWTSFCEPIKAVSHTLTNETAYIFKIFCDKCYCSIGVNYSRFTKTCNNLRIHCRGGGSFWSYIWGKNRPIYMAFHSFFWVLGGFLETGSMPSVVSN